MPKNLRSKFSKTLTIGLLSLALNLPASCSGLNVPPIENQSKKTQHKQANTGQMPAKGYEKKNLENDIKRVPILMYHDINQPKKSNYSDRYCVTPNMFRRQLQLMYDKNYVPISLEEYLENDFSSVPKDMKPYMITFDDSTRGQFRYKTSKEGRLKIDSDCAVAILNKFAQNHKYFEKDAVFFMDFVDKDNYFRVPFAQKGLEKKKINYLTQHGYDVQNHTALHPFLGKNGYRKLYNNIHLYNYMVNYSPEHRAIAYPYGDVPRDSSKIKFLQKHFNVGFRAFANEHGVIVPTTDSGEYEKWNIHRLEINNNLKNIKMYVLN